MRLHLILTQYSKEKVRTSAGGAPTAALIDIRQIQSLGKKADQLAQLDMKLREHRATYLPHLQAFCASRQARLELAVYGDLVLRCLLAKPWPLDLEVEVKMATGKFSADEVKALGIAWGGKCGSQVP